MSDIGIGIGTTQDNGFQSQALQNLDKDAFLQLLVAQMRYQNPMNPVDSNEYLAQAAQYASVEQLENMAESQAELRSMQMVTIATGLVGQQVTAVDGLTGQTVTGVVETVKFGAEPLLIVDGFEIPLSAVASVGEAIPSETPGGEPESGTEAPDGSQDDRATLEPPVPAEEPTDIEPDRTPDPDADARTEPQLSTPRPR